MTVTVRWPVGPNRLCVSDFGVIDHTCPRPYLGEVGPLLIAPADWARRLCGSPLRRHGGLWDGTIRGGRHFCSPRCSTPCAMTARCRKVRDDLWVGRWPD